MERKSLFDVVADNATDADFAASCRRVAAKLRAEHEQAEAERLAAEARLDAECPGWRDRPVIEDGED